MWLSAVSNSFLYSSGQPRSLFPLGPVRPLGNVTPALYGPAEPGRGLAPVAPPTLKWKGEQIAIKRPSHAHLFLLQLWVSLPFACLHAVPKTRHPCCLRLVNLSLSDFCHAFFSLSPPCIPPLFLWRLTDPVRLKLPAVLCSFLSFHVIQLCLRRCRRWPQGRKVLDLIPIWHLSL